ncbi:MAG: ATP-binding protein [Solidesulfovibrio sp.]
MIRPAFWVGCCLLALWCALAAVFPAKADMVPALELTAEERQFLTEHPVISLAVSGSILPFQDIAMDGDGPHYVGLAADYLKLLQPMLGVAFTPRFGLTFNRALELAQTGGVDLFACVADTPKRRTFLTFTRPYVSFPYVLICRQGASFTASIKGLRGKTLAVAPAYYAYDMLQREHPDLGVRYLFQESAHKAMAAVAEGQADATILNLAVATSIINSSGYANLRISTPLAWEQNALCMASPHPVLASIIQKALDAIPQKRKDALTASWLEAGQIDQGPSEVRPLPYILIAGALVVIFGLMVWWNRRLKSEVNHREATEQDLAAHRELLEAVFNATSDVILVLDETFHVLMVNKNGTKRFGLDEEAMLGRGILELTDAPVAASRREHYRHALATGQPVAFIDSRAGYTFDNIIYPLPAAPGGRQRLAIYAQDITEQLATEEALKKSQERLAKIFRLTPAVVIIISQVEERFLEINDAFTTLTGYTRDDVLGRSNAEIGLWLNPVDRDHIDRAIERDGLVQNLEISPRFKDGRVATGLLSCIAIEAYGQACLLAVFVDITDRKATEEALRLAKDAAEAANQAKSRFLSTMSHEIRTPMNTILGMVDVLRETALTSRQQEFLHTLELSGEALMALLTDILELSRIESGTLVMAQDVYNPQELARQVEVMLAPQALAKGLALSVHSDADVGCEAYGDAAKIRQILVNLVGNSIKFTASGETRLTLRRLPARITREELLFSVSDTGIGIPPEKLEVIFQPFTQVDSSTTRAFGGTGLGLAISTLLVEGMGGRLWVESQPGEGSTFYCAVPLDGRTHREQNQEQTPANRLTTAPSALSLKRSLLIVEDSAPNRTLYALFLEDLPLSLHFAENAANALKAYDAMHFDAVVMDIQLPDIDGLTVIKEIRRREAAKGCRPIPILVVTAYAFREDNNHAYEAGCNALMTKPVQKSRFLEALGQLLSEADVGKTNKPTDAWTTPPDTDYYRK